MHVKFLETLDWYSDCLLPDFDSYWYMGKFKTKKGE